MFLKNLFRRTSQTVHPPMHRGHLHSRSNQHGQSFVLEEILTLSGLVDAEEFQEIPDLPDNIAEALVNSLNGDNLPDSVGKSDSAFDSGVFQVTGNGEVGFDWLFDGGGYQGEMGIFSLDGMEAFDPESSDFIRESAQRVTSSSNLGHLVFSDRTEGAKFNGGFPRDGNHNSGEYLGTKTFEMRPGDRFGIMLVPNGTFQEVLEDPDIGGAKRPLYSLATANPEDHFHVGQLADVTGDGKTFVIEDLRVDTGSDEDYNDFIFRVEGAEGEAASLDGVIDPDFDWRDSALGKEILDYANSFLEPDDPIIVLAPEGQTQVDLELLFPELPGGDTWEFEVLDEGTQDLDPQIGTEEDLLISNQPEADIDRIAVKATNEKGETYIQRPILVAHGPDPSTTEAVTELLNDFGEILDAPEPTAPENAEKLTAVVERLDGLIEDKPATLKFLLKPEILEALEFEPSQVEAAYQVIHSELIGQQLGLPVSIYEAITDSDAGAWERFQIEAHDLTEVNEGDYDLTFVGFIGFTAQEHDENTLRIFESVDGLADQDYSLVHADDGDCAERLIA